VRTPGEPSQAAAVAEGEAFAATIGAPRKRLFGKSGRVRERPGPYFDGGFGVGKIHLLASLWHAAPAPKAYGTFVEFTNLVGVLGFAEAVRRLAGHRLVAIDEFELDDPGDTMLITWLLTELTAVGVRWPPGSPCCGWTARTTGTAACLPPRSRCPTTSWPPALRRLPARHWTISTRCAPTWPGCTPPATGGWWPA
jgi:hypothetical protein